MIIGNLNAISGSAININQGYTTTTAPGLGGFVTLYTVPANKTAKIKILNFQGDSTNTSGSAGNYLFLGDPTGARWLAVTANGSIGLGKLRSFCPTPATPISVLTYSDSSELLVKPTDEFTLNPGLSIGLFSSLVSNSVGYAIMVLELDITG